MLRDRLGRLGAGRDVEVHENRTVLVSTTKGGTLRVHRGFAYASDRTLRAILTFVDTTVRRQARKKAEKELVSFPVDSYVPGRTNRRRARPKPRDLGILAQLKRLHRSLNVRHFGGALRAIPFRISDRMRTRVGEVSVDLGTGRVTEISISRRHVLKDLWSEVESTVLHEMIHQWQAEAGLSVDHGAVFRAKAAEVGVTGGEEGREPAGGEGPDSLLVARVS